jgi:CRP-like cAMP-binding protein
MSTATPPPAQLEAVHLPSAQIVGLLERLALLEAFSVREKTLLAQGVDIWRCPMGVHIFNTGDRPRGLLLIALGSCAETRDLGSGVAETLYQLGPGDVPGLTAILGRHAHTSTCEAREGVALIEIPYDRFDGMLGPKNPLGIKLLGALMTAAGERMRRVATRVRDLADAPGGLGPGMLGDGDGMSALEALRIEAVSHARRGPERR